MFVSKGVFSGKSMFVSKGISSSKSMFSSKSRVFSNKRLVIEGTV